MKFSKYLAGSVIAVASLMASSCVDDLNVEPNDPNVNTAPSSKEDMLGYLAAVYYDLYTDAGLSLSDGGRGVFSRCHFDLNEITSDELFISEKWQDPGYQVLNKNIWTDTNEWIYAAFSRENHTCKIASTFIQAIHEYGSAWFTEEEIKQMDAEARALRAYAYYQNIDLFGRGPWIDENSATGATPPTYDRKQLFEATVADLTAYVDNLLPAAQQTYGRLSREAGYMILAKLYLNAEVYTGTPMWQQCADALKNVVATGLQLAPEYKYLFCASNSKYVGNGEIVFGLPQDRNRLTTWGGTTELTCAAYMEADDSDTPLSRQLLMLNFPGTPWSGLRVRPELSKALKGDPRRLIYEGSYQEDIPDLTAYNETSCGYMLIKYTFTTEDDYYNTALVNKFDHILAYNTALNNSKEVKPEDVAAIVAEATDIINASASVKDEEKPGLIKNIVDNLGKKDLSAEAIAAAQQAYPQPDTPDQMSEVDLPVFRLADAYLMLAECQLNGANVNINGLDGYAYFNKVRARVGLAPIAQPTANEILHERQCELYAEGFRRSDLIRFNRYTGSNYLWSWKGGDFTGTAIPDTRAVFPIPYQYVITVGQNAGY